MNISLVSPVPPGTMVTQLFGENSQLYARWGYDGHNGIDYGVSTGTIIKSPADGTVSKIAYETGGYGIYIALDHGEFLTYYAHLRKALVLPGQKVKAGDVIAESDNTGYSTGPHLHFGLKIPSQVNPGYKNYHDPAPYFAADPADETQAQATTDPPASSLVTVTAPRGLYVRSGPSTDAPALGVAALGTRLTQQGTKGEWVEIAAYVHRDWVK